MIPSELQKIEMKLDRKLLEERKGIESQLRTKLQVMKPLLRFNRELQSKYSTHRNVFYLSASYLQL